MIPYYRVTKLQAASRGTVFVTFDFFLDDVNCRIGNCELFVPELLAQTMVIGGKYQLILRAVTSEAA